MQAEMFMQLRIKNYIGTLDVDLSDRKLFSRFIWFCVNSVLHLFWEEKTGRYGGPLLICPHIDDVSRVSNLPLDARGGL